MYGIDAGGTWLNSWFLTSVADVPRNYHSVALLLPDGRVWTASSNKNGAGTDCNQDVQCDGTADGLPDTRELRVEVFTPWYIGHEDRPVITSCPESVEWQGEWQGQIEIGVASDGYDINKVALMRPGSFTHGFDADPSASAPRSHSHAGMASG